jgi:hypothetical protein
MIKIEEFEEIEDEISARAQRSRNPSSRVDQLYAAAAPKSDNSLQILVGQIISGLQVTGGLLALVFFGIADSSLENNPVIVLVPATIIASLCMVRGRFESLTLTNISMVLEAWTLIFWLKTITEMSDGGSSLIENMETPLVLILMVNALITYLSILCERVN